MGHLKTFTDDRGCLSVVDIDGDVPFKVQRVFWIYDVPEGMGRGKHSSLSTYEYIVVVKGSVNISLEDADGKKNYELSLSNLKGLLVPPLTWIELNEFSKDAILLVFASEPYRPETYINDYEEFLRIIKK